MEPKDWLALLLAALALLVSLAVAAYTVRSERRMAMMATYERVHEQLVQPSTATGRRALFLHSPNSSFPAPRSANHDAACDCGQEPDLWDVMNQAVAWYDTLATYYRQGEVPRRVVLRAWYHPLIAARPHIYRFLDHRARQGIEQPWDALQSLLELCLWYRCRCRTCELGRRPEPQVQPVGYLCECVACQGQQRSHPLVQTSQPWWLPLAQIVDTVRKKPRSRAGLVSEALSVDLRHSSPLEAPDDIATPPLRD